MNHEIRLANENDSELLADKISDLLTELSGVTRNKDEFIEVTRRLLEESSIYYAFLAFVESECIGVITVAETESIYAGGRFGIIQELYVKPEYRSSGIGQRLIKTVREHALLIGWTRIEVGAPDPSKWERTVAFYEREGFSQIGPRLSMKFS